MSTPAPATVPANRETPLPSSKFPAKRQSTTTPIKEANPLRGAASFSRSSLEPVSNSPSPSPAAHCPPPPPFGRATLGFPCPKNRKAPRRRSFQQYWKPRLLMQNREPTTPSTPTTGTAEISVFSHSPTSLQGGNLPQVIQYFRDGGQCRCQNSRTGCQLYRVGKGGLPLIFAQPRHHLPYHGDPHRPEHQLHRIPVQRPPPGLQLGGEAALPCPTQ